MINKQSYSKILSKRIKFIIFVFRHLKFWILIRKRISHKPVLLLFFNWFFNVFGLIFDWFWEQ